MSNTHGGGGGHPIARPGWYRDPGDPRALRYWDGYRWTEHVAPAPAPPVIAPRVIAPPVIGPAPMSPSATTTAAVTTPGKVAPEKVAPGRSRQEALGIEATRPRRRSPAAPAPGEHVPSSRPRAGGARLPWWQRWHAVIPALILIAPLGIFLLWRRPGVEPSVRVIVSATSATFLVLVMLAPPSDNAPTAASAPPATTAPAPRTSSSAPPPTPTAAATPTTVILPSLYGLSVQEAGERLAAAGLTLGSMTKQPSAKRPGTVLTQKVPKGTRVSRGRAINLIIAAPYPRVPSVNGNSQSTAVAAAKKAGFVVLVKTITRTSGVDGMVVSQSPKAGTRRKPGSQVTLYVADVRPPAPVPLVGPRPTKPSQPAGGGNCTPGYSPCLPPASDYDCAGGSGNGPKYANGPIIVTGSDPYRLDADDDGVGCE